MEGLFEYKIRFRIFLTLIIAVVGLLMLRLVQLQLINADEYSGESRNNAVREVRVRPARGVVYDRNGVLMVDNEQTYTLMVAPRYFNTDRIGLLSDLLGLPDSTVARKIVDAREWNAFQPSPIMYEVTLDVISRIEENRYRLPGVTYEEAQRRRYLTEARAMHALGYVREIARGELEQRRSQGYRAGDLIGKAGLERTYEEELRGEMGRALRQVNKHGREVKAFRDGRDDIPPKSGYDLHLTLDSRVQTLAESLFVNKRGAAVAIDPTDGGIIALVSKPDIDPRLFSKRVTRSAWEELARTEDDPLFNRATMSEQPPGSTWKPFMALAALQAGVITPTTVYQCRGRYVLYNRAFRDFGETVHGRINVTRAIQESCNSFFFHVMMELGLARFNDYATQFGFGQLLQMDIGEQQVGLIPDSSYYDRTYPRGWTSGYTINLGVGQGDMLVTPMQLARYAAAIGNNGVLQPPHLVEAVRHPETGETLPVDLPEPQQINIESQYFEVVRDGMRRVMEKGTGRWSQIPGVASGGKTGTAQAPGDQKDHSLFILIAPIDDPQIAIAVFVENGGFGATQAAPIAGLLGEQYLNGEIAPLGRWRIGQLMQMESE